VTIVVYTCTFTWRLGLWHCSSCCGCGCGCTKLIDGKRKKRKEKKKVLHMHVIFGDAKVYESRWGVGCRHEVRIFSGLFASSRMYSCHAFECSRIRLRFIEEVQDGCHASQHTCTCDVCVDA
jgi:hypothetical protein